MIVVDTSVWIDYFRGNEHRESVLLDSLLSEEIVILVDVVMLELLMGIKDMNHRKLVESTFEVLEKKAMVSFENATKYAEMYVFLRSKGFTIRKTNDVIIAGFCILNSYPLLQRDRDFIPYKKHLGLRMM